MSTQENRSWGSWGVLLAAMAVVLAACDGGDSAEPADTTRTTAKASETRTATEADFDDPFLNAVAEADRPADEAIETFSSRLQTQYTDRNSYLDAFTDIGLRDAISTFLDQARDLDPPEKYAEEFRLWVDNLEEELELAGELDEALEARDLGAVASAVTRLNAEFRGVLFEITASSPDFCRAVASDTSGDPGVERQVESTCVTPDDLPGGEYGREANLIAREVAATVFPLIGTAPLNLLDDDERVALLAQIQPTVEAEFARARERLSTLSPPEDLAEDHEAALTFFRDIGDVARRITEAAEANDQEALPRLFDESAQPGTALDTALSEQGRAVFGTLLVDP